MSLVISELIGSDQQQYVCQASNLVSVNNAVVSLSVLGLCCMHIFPMMQ